MTIQKRHLEFIAATLKCAKPAKERVDAYTQWLYTVHTFAQTCAANNPNFKRHIFMDACGLEEENA